MKSIEYTYIYIPYRGLNEACKTCRNGSYHHLTLRFTRSKRFSFYTSIYIWLHSLHFLPSPAKPLRPTRSPAQSPSCPYASPYATKPQPKPYAHTPHCRLKSGSGGRGGGWTVVAQNLLTIWCEKNNVVKYWLLGDTW